jgi:hypothetical protein
MTTCQITALGTPFRKKKRSLIENNPVLKIGEELEPYYDYITASKVSKLDHSSWPHGAPRDKKH